MNTIKKQESFTKAYNKCHEPFIRYCSAVAFGKMEVDDLVQDVLLSAYKNFDNIQDPDLLLHYLIRSARNKISSFWRAPKFQEEIAENHSNRLESKGVSPDVILDVEYLYKMIDRLPNGQKQALIMFEISGFSMKEIAIIQESNESAVKTKISRGRQKLRELFEEAPRPKSIQTVFQTIQSITL